MNTPQRLSCLLFVLPALACGKKKVETAAPIVGWHTEEGWAGSCYYPPEYSALDDIPRKMARAAALDAMISQWTGKRDDGIDFDADHVEDLETVLLGRPTKTEQVSRDNLERCKQVMGAGGSADDWYQWLHDLPAKLTAGECNTPFDYTMFDYLDIGTGWQRPLNMCQGDRIHINATEKDRYRVTDGGPWINADGDSGSPALGTKLPCNQENCLAGQLIGRFVTESGIETIFPIGVSKVFEAPEHGEISYRINDDTFFDNTWYKQGTIEDHTAIEIHPDE